MIKKANKKLVKLASIIMIGAMLLTGCGAGKDVVAKVNGETISVEEYSKVYNMVRQNYEADFLSQEGPEGKTMEQMLKEDLLEDLIMQKIIIQEGKDKGFEPKEEEVEKQIEEMKEQLGGKENFEESLKQDGMTIEELKTELTKQMIFMKYEEDFFENVKLEDKELRENYKENKEAYDEIRASHIIVEKEEEAKSIIKELESGEDFEKLAVKSIEPNAEETKGDLDYFGRGAMIPEFEEAAFNLDIDQISEPVKTEHGFHIIKVTDKKDTFEELKEKIKTQVTNEKFAEKIEKLREEAKVETYMENIENIEEPQEETEKQPETKKDEKEKEEPKDQKKSEPKEEKNNN